MRPLGRLSPWLLTLLLIAIAAAAFALSLQERTAKLPPRPADERPTLMLVTSLPLIFSEHFSLESAGSPTLDALESRYSVVPIGVADAQSLKPGDLLLMAHPLAQPAEVLVELDAWVRGGGRALILADPRLDWPSELPLGDIRRPPPFYADTGLLGHWGLRLDAPDEPGPQQRLVDGRRVLLESPGTLAGHCPIAGDGLVARCSVGKGRATVIADADLLQPRSGSADQRDSNHQFILAELDRLER